MLHPCKFRCPGNYPRGKLHPSGSGFGLGLALELGLGTIFLGGNFPGTVNSDGGFVSNYNVCSNTIHFFSLFTEYVDYSQVSQYNINLNQW